MKRPSLVLGLYVLLVFLSGVIVGAFASRFYMLQAVSAKTAPRTADDYRHKYLEEMRTRLNLREDQVQQLDAILDSTRLRYREFREKHNPELAAVQEEQVSKIRAILTEPQRLEYEKMRAQREKRRRQSSGSPQRW